MKTIVTALVLGLYLSTTAFAGEPGIAPYRGELNGSHILIVSPGKWNKKLLLLAHGHRDESEALHADFPYESMFYQTLLKEGWLVASTSYRRNGVIIEEAIDDLDDLLKFVIDKYGKPQKVYIKGASMGGIISLLISERFPDRADGILNECNPIPEKIPFSRSPKIPTLFISNQDEAPPVRAYLANLAEDGAVPGLWTILRDGHCNFNDDETLEAFRAAVALSEDKPIRYQREFLVMKSDAESVAVYRDGAIHGKVTGFSPAYGNVYTEFVSSDLARIGVAKGDSFTVGFGEKTFSAKLGATYGDVPRGEWVAFFEADGYLKISRNHANAADTLGCKEGDAIYLKK